ncbi:mitochondrial intermembrane space import and assembly protein 40-like isoform X2 [Oncorhynchus keta]|uniref:mitochondrial intermembrane space import and assembly protein 40-like isoform X2 n=1 Tax=Oncorhynchus keta TaxID=8018 RepID=UPI0015FA3B51|nr:mitochondrial intermembrane space import and assembly protein 40-like isoform X2 [Oncorhynchus keta]
MSYCKDRIIFVTKEDHEAPSNAELIADDPNDPYEDQGLILPSGEINWNCPCLGGMASGPCGTQFKEAFSCFHYSNEEVKGSECIDNFRAMQECMQKYPELYPQEDENEGVAAGGADATAAGGADATAAGGADATAAGGADATAAGGADATAVGGADTTAPVPAEGSAPVDSTSPELAEDSSSAPVASGDSTLSSPTPESALSSDNTPPTDSQAAS